jgi:hypothetical protein
MTMMERPIEYWTALVGMCLYVFTKKDADANLIIRSVKTSASALIAFSMTDDVSSRLHVTASAAAVIVMAFGLIGLDIATSLIADRRFIRDIIRQYTGGSKSDD